VVRENYAVNGILEMDIGVALSDSRSVHDVVRDVSLHGRMQSEETSEKSNMKDGMSEACKGGVIASTGCLLLTEPHR